MDNLPTASLKKVSSENDAFAKINVQVGQSDQLQPPSSGLQASLNDPSPSPTSKPPKTPTSAETMSSILPISGSVATVAPSYYQSASPARAFGGILAEGKDRDVKTSKKQQQQIQAATSLLNNIINGSSDPSSTLQAPLLPSSATLVKSAQNAKKATASEISSSVLPLPPVDREKRESFSLFRHTGTLSEGLQVNSNEPSIFSIDASDLHPSENPLLIKSDDLNLSTSFGDQHPEETKLETSKFIKIPRSNSLSSLSSSLTPSLSSMSNHSSPTSFVLDTLPFVHTPTRKSALYRCDPTQLTADELANSDAIYNTELSELDFFWRVLHQSLDVRTPLLERLKFLAITASNLDGFFCKRIGALIQRLQASGSGAASSSSDTASASSFSNIGMKQKLASILTSAARESAEDDDKDTEVQKKPEGAEKKQATFQVEIPAQGSPTLNNNSTTSQKKKAGPVPMTIPPQTILQTVGEEVRPLVAATYDVFMNKLVPELHHHNIHLLRYSELNEWERDALREFFLRDVFPLLTPLTIDQGHPWPAVSNWSLNVAVVLFNKVSGETRLGRVKVPPGRPRWVSIPTYDEYSVLPSSPLADEIHEEEEEDEEAGGSEQQKKQRSKTNESPKSKCRNSGGRYFVAMEELIMDNLDILFPRLKVLAAAPFRVTRSAEVEIDEDQHGLEESMDLLERISEHLRLRKFAPVVRLEVGEDMPATICEMLLAYLSLKERDVYIHPRYAPLGLADLFSLSSSVSMTPSLKFDPWTPVTHPRLLGISSRASPASLFSAIRQGDVMVVHPFHSFIHSVQLFIECAANDPSVRVIKCTLYRTSSDSPIVNALIQAANAGKEVYAFVELKATFDEKQNAMHVQALEMAGCHVSYGMQGLKTHAKMMLAIREEENGLCPYFHIGTGNYNDKTSKLYVDVGILSCDPEIGADLLHAFNMLSGCSRKSLYRKLLVSPVAMRDQLIQRIRKLAKQAREGRNPRIIACLNGLNDKVMVRELYAASTAGVKISLAVRGVCRLRPQVPGISDNIRVISIVGRFLEHSRVYCFLPDDKEPKVFIGSSDWQTRNLMHRVEVLMPVLDPEIRSKLVQQVEMYFNPRNIESWHMMADGTYRKPILPDGDQISLHYKMMRFASEIARQKPMRFYKTVHN